MLNINSLIKSFLPLIVLVTLSQTALADSAKNAVKGGFSIGTGAQYGGFGVQAGANFNRASVYLFGGDRSVGLGTNIRLNQFTSFGISYGGGFSADIAEVVINEVLFDDADDDCFSNEYQNWYVDSDGDGLGNPDTEVILCGVVGLSGYVTNGNDTDDSCASNVHD